jgi:hypothetical protein
MRGAVPKNQSRRATTMSQQESKLPPLISIDNDGKPSKLMEASVKQQEYPPLIQVVTNKFCAFQGLYKKKEYLFGI